MRGRFAKWLGFQQLQQIAGLHPDSEGMGTKSVREISDFGSVIKALFNRGSLKAAKNATTETISAPAQKQS